MSSSIIDKRANRQIVFVETDLIWSSLNPWSLSSVLTFFMASTAVIIFAMLLALCALRAFELRRLSLVILIGPARRSLNAGGPARRSSNAGGPARHSLGVGGPKLFNAPSNGLGYGFLYAPRSASAFYYVGDDNFGNAQFAGDL